MSVIKYLMTFRDYINGVNFCLLFFYYNSLQQMGVIKGF